MKLSRLAWQQIHPIYLTVQHHRFNQELLNGSLPFVKFRRFLQQDVYYLSNLARCFGIIGRKTHSHSHFFLNYEDDGFKDELDCIHYYSLQDNDSPPTDPLSNRRGAVKKSEEVTWNGLTSATRDYTDYLLRTAAFEPVEIAIASVLPCFWFFRELGVSMSTHEISTQTNPYARWINTYSDQRFSDSVNQMIQLFDEVAFFSSDEMKKRMLSACNRSAQFEWRFVNELDYPLSYSPSLFKKPQSVAARSQNETIDEAFCQKTEADASWVNK